MTAARSKIPVISVRGQRVWRCLPSRFIETALESGPSFTRDRRYSIQGEFGAVYFSGSAELAEREAAEHGQEDREPVTYLAYELTLDKMVNLTRKETRSAMGVTLDNLVKPRTAKDRYDITQHVARRVYTARLNGILAPTVHDPGGLKSEWFNVILYPAHLMQSCLKLISHA